MLARLLTSRHFAQTTSEKKRTIKSEDLKNSKPLHSVMSDWSVDTNLFCNELAIQGRSFIQRITETLRPLPLRSIQSRLMFHPRLGTRQHNFQDDSGGVATGSTVAIAGVMGVGTAVTLLMNPVGLGVGAGLALSGIYKFFSSPQERILREAEAKAEETVQNLGKLCEKAIGEHADAVDELVGQFYLAAESIYTPIAKKWRYHNVLRVSTKGDGRDFGEHGEICREHAGN